MIQNEMSKALEDFSDTYTELIKQKFSAGSVTRENLIERLSEISQVKDKSLLTQIELASLQNYRRDLSTGGFMFHLKNLTNLEAYFEEVANRTSRMDLKSYDFQNDPDCVVISKI